MVMPCPTSSSRASTTGGALIVGAVAGHVDHALHAPKRAFGKEVGAEIERARNRGAACAVRRLRRKLLGNPFASSRVATPSTAR